MTVLRSMFDLDGLGGMHRDTALLIAEPIGFHVLMRKSRDGAGGGVLLAASVGRTLSPSASVVVLLKSDFLAYYC